MSKRTESIECPQCRHINPTGAVRCSRCSSSLGDFNETIINETVVMDGETPWSMPHASTAEPWHGQAVGVGDVIGGRYEILSLLGEGGMGAVYKARDRELDRTLALKVIRPDLAGKAAVLERFKQELILARQITHKHVIRIFDLGSAGSLRFITMEFVEGRDLASMLRERPLTVQETLEIVGQVCLALEAAHAESVVHRDLKPQNIMINERGKVSVMDFGLAFSTEVSGVTQTGALMGTPAYMSPEQGQGQPLDARSDLYSLGIIFYEMLTGDIPFKADSMIVSLMQRSQAPPPAPITIKPAIPRPVNDAVMKCLAVDRAGRYQSASEMLRDLESLLRDPDSQPGRESIPAMRRRGLHWLPAALASLLVVTLLVAFLWRDRLMNRVPTTSKPVTVLIADFTNATGESVFDNTLESMVNITLEGASFINAYDRGQARKMAATLQSGASRLDDNLARLVALREGINVVITGSIARKGDGYQISAIAINPLTGKTVATSRVNASSRQAVLAMLPKLSAPIRRKLGDSTPESAQVAAAGTLGSSSLEAVHLYGAAMQQQFAGNMEQALQTFAKCAELDPHFARAYSGMAAVSGNLRRFDDADKYIKLALQNIGQMTERERLRTRGLYYARTHDVQKCIEEYSDLVKQYPVDNIGHNNLANCLSQSRAMQKAVEEERRAVEIVPKSAAARNNLSLFATYSGDFQTGEREARTVRQSSPNYVKGYVALAFALLGEDRIALGQEAYRELEKVDESWAASGLADVAMYEGRFKDAEKILLGAAAKDVAANRKDLAAEKFAALAYSQLVSHREKAAGLSAEKALEFSKSAKIKFLTGRVFAETGNTRAQSLAAELGSDFQPELQAYAKLIHGEIEMKAHNPQQAVKAITEANRLLDTWLGHYDLGRAYLSANLFAQADDEFDKCVKRRGETLSLFVDEVPTYGHFPPVYYYQGLVLEGLKSPDFTGKYKAYLAIRGAAGEDPLLPEIRRHL